jgi:HEXXH motif-containing protein
MSPAAEAAAWARPFSCPQEGSNRELSHEIVAAHAQAYRAEFLEHFGDLLAARSPGLAELLRSLDDHEVRFDDAWDVSVGYMRRAVLDDDPESALQHAAALGLRLNAFGVPGEWEVELGDARRLRLDGWLLPAARKLSVRAQPDSIEVGLGAKLRRGAEFERYRGAWRGRGAEPLPSERVYGCPVTVLEEPALDGLRFGGELTFSRLTPDQILAKVRRSMQLLRDCAPEYLPWTQGVLRSVIPLHAERSEIRSGSDLDKPGAVQASFPIRTVALAETWVHECSHQYFQILTRVGPLEDGTDTELYYSPVRQMGRPIAMILLAYHAFANVLLFYRSCRAAGPANREYLEVNELRLVPQLRQLEAPLRKTPALTELGRALFEPLAARIEI